MKLGSLSSSIYCDKNGLKLLSGSLAVHYSEINCNDEVRFMDYFVRYLRANGFDLHGFFSSVLNRENSKVVINKYHNNIDCKDLFGVLKEVYHTGSVQELYRLVLIDEQRDKIRGFLRVFSKRRKFEFVSPSLEKKLAS